MTPTQIQLVKASFGQVLPIREQAATLFYDRLFELDPALRPLFKGDMTQQGVKLMTVLAVVVRGLDQLEPLLPTIDALALRHHGYGVREAHYDTVGQALLWALQQGLGTAFTPNVCLAWAAAYDLLSSRMIASGGRARAA